MSRALLRTRNVLKAWALLFGLCATLGIVPLLTGNYRLLSIFLFCALLLAGAGYFYADRIALGMVGARELQRGEVPALHSTVERLAALAGVPKPRLYLLTDGYPRALSAGAWIGLFYLAWLTSAWGDGSPGPSLPSTWRHDGVCASLEATVVG